MAMTIKVVCVTMCQMVHESERECVNELLSICV
jgi:hypothetical protein